MEEMGLDDKDKKNKAKKDDGADLVMQTPATGLPKTTATAVVDGDLTIKELLELLEKVPKDDSKDDAKKDSKPSVLKFEKSEKAKYEKYLDTKISQLIDKVLLGSFNHNVVEVIATRQGVQMSTNSEAENIIRGMLQKQLDILGERGVEKKKIVVSSCSPKTKEMIQKFCDEKKVVVEFTHDPKANQNPKSSTNSTPGASIRFGG